VRTIYGRLFQAIGVLNTVTGLGALAGRRAAATAEILDLLRQYPRKRLQLHILDMVLSVYRKLLGNAPEYLREINFCRATLTDMHAALTASAPALDDAGGKLILPDGCATLDDAADQFLAGLAPEDLLAFEQALQKEVTRKLRGLGSVCLKAKEKGQRFRDMLLERSREFLDTKFGHSDPAEVFFRYRTDDGSTGPLIGEAFASAAPKLASTRDAEPQLEVNVLAVPPGPAGDRFRELAEKMLPGSKLIPAPMPDDICFYREYPLLEITDLPQFGEHAREAYHYLTMSDHPPHARVDIPWQPPES
jgi:hypothetical protein